MPLYKQDPNDTSKQIPDSTPRGIHRYSYATCPAASTKTKRPSYVIVNKTGTYKFSYESTPSTYITGSNVQSANAGGVKLDISPTAWATTGAAGAVGDITFVYVRVR